MSVLEVGYWRRADSPVGPLLLVGSGTGLVQITFTRGDGISQALEVVAARAGLQLDAVPDASGELGDVCRQLGEYFAGDRRVFDVPLDWRLAGGFQSDVLRALGEVSYGRTVSYRELAELAGRPAAVRAAASACARNPFPIVLGCHRIIRADGRPGEYLGGRDAKRALLALEAAG